ncbi:MAG: hypothetical protein J1F23_08740 [Oscillospiraceae bacterium]|nr:hypothetical protein [Oscillospiraceae bacterium]
MDGLNTILFSITASAITSAFVSKIITAKHLKAIDSYFKDGIKDVKRIVVETINKRI